GALQPDPGAATLGRGPLSVARAGPLPGSTPEHTGPRIRAHLFFGLRHRDVARSAWTAARALVVRERRPSRVRADRAPGGSAARERLHMVGHRLLPRLPGGRGAPRSDRPQ